MQLDRRAIRLLGRIAERTATISKNPHRYELDGHVLGELCRTGDQLERLLARVDTIKVGATTVRRLEPSNR